MQVSKIRQGKLGRKKHNLCLFKSFLQTPLFMVATVSVLDKFLGHTTDKLPRAVPEKSTPTG